MKKLLTLMFSATLIMCYSFSLHAQEKVQESRIKIIKTTDEGTMSIDTVFTGDNVDIGAFLKSMELDEDIDIQIDGDAAKVFSNSDSDVKVIAKTIVINTDDKNAQNSRFITMDLTSEMEIDSIDGEKVITIIMKSDEDERHEIIWNDDAQGNKKHHKNNSTDVMRWVDLDNDSIEIHINGEMELLDDKMNDIEVIMSEMNDMDFDGDHEMHKEFFVNGEHAFVFFDGEMGTMRLKIQDIDESEKEYIERAGVKQCKKGFDPKDLQITKNRIDNSMRIQFSVLQGDEYQITLLNEDLVKIFDEKLEIFAGKYDRLVDISGKNKAFYLNIRQGKICYTKKIIMP